VPIFHKINEENIAAGAPASPPAPQPQQPKPGPLWFDDATAVEAFVKTTRIHYPVLIGGVDAIETSRQLGNRLQGLPFTAIFDRNGNLIYAQTGPLTRSRLEERITPLL